MNARKLLIPILMVTAAAALAPAALANRPDDRAGARDVGGITTPSISLVRPDDRAGVRGPGGSEAQQPAAATRPDDRVGVRGPGSIVKTAVQPVSSGFDWGDALIGGLGGIGTTLVLMGVLFLATSRRSRARVA